MANPKVLFVFNAAAQWVPLSGNTASTGFCNPWMVLLDGDAAMTIAGRSSSINVGATNYPQAYPSAGVGGVPTVLTLASGSTATISFTVVDGTGNSLAYFLSGLAVKRLGATPGQGDAVFPALNVQVNNGATTLNVEDDNDDTGGSSTTYDFWVMVQNAAGDVGLIDPLITNAS